MDLNKPNLRHLLLTRAEWMEQRLYANAERNGYGDITPSMSRLMALLAGRPQGLSDLARRLGITRQAVHKLATEANALGYVEFFDSPSDARIKLLRFTRKGREMAASAEQELARIEAGLCRHIGTHRLQVLKEILAMPWSEEEANK